MTRPTNLHPIVGVAEPPPGLVQPRELPADPFAALDDLMLVVEALCPRWPARAPLTETSKNRM